MKRLGGQELSKVLLCSVRVINAQALAEVVSRYSKAANIVQLNVSGVSRYTQRT